MKAFSKFFFLAFVMIFSGKLAAQETIQINNNLSQYYDYELFKWDLLSGRIMYGNLTSSVSNIAYNRDMVKRLQSYADTKQYYEIFKKQNSTGNISMRVGVSLYLIGASGMALSAIAMDYDYFSIENGMALLAGSAGTFVIGMIVSLIGISSSSSGMDSLYNSLSLYNRHKIEEYNK
ncbi:MAG: hypothetical protein LBC53_04100 [Spirochaetaceae bacterium]|jgi:hypothetical protein|nr:hypothetical protein [Spirochaetaceae bacterium]